MRRRLAALAVAAAAALAAFVGASWVNAPVASPPSFAKTACSGSIDYPDHGCTPGATDPRVTQATIHTTICVPGWTATVRHTSQALKDQVLAEYGLSRPFAGEIDHFISLELGGADTLANLWPEPGKIPNPKDAVENRLHRQVCMGTLTLAQARAEITQWTSYQH